MKQPARHRILSLLLALFLLLSLSAPAFAAEGDSGQGPGASTGPDDGDGSGDGNGGSGDTPSTPPTITIRSGGNRINDETQTISTGKGPQVTATVAPAENAKDKITWKSSDEKIARADYDTSKDGHDMYLYGVAPGEATITAETSTGGKASFPVTVSGMVFKSDTITIKENTRLQLLEYDEGIKEEDFWIKYFGTAKTSNEIRITSDKTNILRATGDTKGGLYIDAIAEGIATITIRVTQGGQPVTESTIRVTVERNEAQIIYGNASSSSPLRFSTIESKIAAQCKAMMGQSDGDTSLVSITSLNVDTAQGTLYLNYKSADDTGSGVGSALTYTAAGSARGPYIGDISFVPNPSYTGATATVDYTGTAANGRTFRGKIVVNIASATTDVTLTASPENPAKLSGSAFGEVCQRQTGAPLSYVMFTLPPATQGILYEGYVSDSDYTARVTANEQYNQTALNDLTFVPTPGYVGMVDIGYAGYSATGIRYNGELRINVTQSLDESIIYRDGGTGSVYLSESDFSAYCVNVTGGRLGYVKFTPPAASQGTLYRSWRNGRGTAVTADDEFSTASQINQLYFVATDGFHGTVRVPFSGEDRNGVPFTGTMEIHIQSGGAGDITYTCTPGGSVKFTASDFNDMSLKLTGQRLHYITFQTLPNYTDGAFYHNRTSANAMGESVSRDARYYNSSAPYLMNLSFWASDSFRGSIEIPFTGCAVSGETFSGLLVISSSSSTGSSNVVSYDTMGRQSVLFNAGDFDKVSLAATNSSLNYVRFNLPSSSEGILYFDYNPSTTPVTISSTDSLYQSGEATISKVTFLPAYNFSGTVRIPFSGWAISGAQFQGTVEITVRAAATNTTVRYTTRGEPVTFTTYEFQGTGGNQLRSIRLDQLPSASSGKLYYQYTCPTKYSWVAVAGTEYYLGNDPQVSNLTFLPKAGFVGTATIPYTATNTDGTQFTGQISIIVDSTTTSAHFIDLGSCSSEAMASIDFLYSRGVVNGTGDDKYSPELPIRRGDFCLMIYRAFQFSADGAVSLFTDVADDAYYAQAIRVLRSQGIVDGVGNNRFQPTANISRQDAALMVQRTLRAAGMNAADGSSSLLSAYSDGDKVSNYAQGAMACLIQGDMLPSSWSRLWPTNALTRADMAVLLHRAITQ